jgi:hypothetical protein
MQKVYIFGLPYISLKSTFQVFENAPIRVLHFLIFQIFKIVSSILSTGVEL